MGFSSLRALELQTRQQVREQLETILRADLEALDIWKRNLIAVVEVHALDPRVSGALIELARFVRDPESVEALPDLPVQEELRAHFARVLERHGFLHWAAYDLTGRQLAGSDASVVGQRPEGGLGGTGARILEGGTLVSPPLRWGEESGFESDAVFILAGTAVRDEAGEPVAVFGFSLDPERDFSQILQVARVGETGETYAFDGDGLMLSRSRFEGQLREIGLLPEDPDIHTPLRVSVRDPGGNLLEGHTNDEPSRSRPLTRMAAHAVEGRSGFDIDGYADYRGVPVVGAWTWLPEMELGVGTEIDFAEAYRGLAEMRTRFGILIGLLLIGALGMFAYSVLLARLRSQMAEAQQLGRYTVERKIGSGGMGTVYVARHALLCRQTAIKVLRGEQATHEAVARFEREVQVSSQLTHPNTIDIYDFGYTPDGTFYYAMEFLDGITLDRLVEAEGPLSEARVVAIMRQACGSIAEAHDAGLIHRDLKPANVMLCEVGGMYDFAKVLDFGLVREQEQSQDVALTDVTSLTGTPLYMPPEVVRTPDKIDVRADLYQLGAIAYFLLVGRPMFSGESAYEVLAHHLNSIPRAPSEVLGRPVTPELEAIVLRCLEKDPAARPATGRELLEALEICPCPGAWGQREARAWWAAWRERHPEAVGSETATSMPSGYAIDLRRLRTDAHDEG
ncbi:MAG: serine/threonine protein kinase [Myxococcota bacterium]